MLEEEKWCKEIMKKHFNKTLEITAVELEEEMKFKNQIVVILAGLSINHMRLKLEIIVISLVNTEVLHIGNAI